MWKNSTVAAFIEWLRQHNEGLPPERRYRQGAGFLGMDLYSLHESGTRGGAVQGGGTGRWLPGHGPVQPARERYAGERYRGAV